MWKFLAEVRIRNQRIRKIVVARADQGKELRILLNQILLIQIQKHRRLIYLILTAQKLIPAQIGMTL